MRNNIELPIKKTTGDTLEEKMNENAYNRILPARYQRKNADGDLVEEPEEVFERVAKNLALAEVVFESERVGHEVRVTPEQLKETHTSPSKLVEKVFGENISPEEAEEEGMEVTLDEFNVKHFSYDNVVPELENSDVKEHTQGVKEKFQNHMENLDWVPNTPTIINAGDELQMLAACFVTSPDDDMGDIHETAKEAAEIFQGGGGVGYGVWNLRPKGDKVGSTGGGSSGPISFMRTYDQVCGNVEAGGVRRGAQMGVMRISHPDVLEFIHSKDKDVSLAHTLKLNDPDDFTHTKFKEALGEAREILEDYGGVPNHLRNAVEGHLSNFNISVGVTDEFMDAVKNDEMYTFTNPRTNEEFVANEMTVETYEMFGLGEYAEEGEVLEVPAREIWEHMIDGAHENGEPGVVYLERINKQSNFDPEKHPEKKINATNPCGEEPLFEYDSCNLSHINLSTILDEDCDVQDYRDFRDNKLDEMDNSDDIDEEELIGDYLEQAIDWDDLDERIHYNTRFLDNVVTMCDYPIPEIEETTRKSRKVGLGIMGYAQLLIQMGLEYGSDEANEVARRLMTYVNDEAVKVSKSLAVEDEPGMDRGTFEEWDKSKWSEPREYEDWFEKEFSSGDAEQWEEGYPLRNHTLTTCAPTGTTSQLGDTTGGCEPIYSVARFKNVSQDIQGEDMLVQFDDFFLRTLKANDIDVEKVKEDAKKQMDNNEFDGIEGLDEVPDDLGELFVTTEDLTALEHASVQCAFQEGVGSAISKTINAPNDATVDDAKEAFEFVYDNGGKGVTYYRDGSRSKQVLTTRRKNKEFADDDELLEAVREAVVEDEEILNDLLGLVVELSDEDQVILERVSEELGAEMNSVSGKREESDDVEALGLSEYRKRPDNLVGATIRVSTGYGSLYVTLNEDENGNLFEVICEIGKSGGLKASFTESLGRMISMALRYGVPPERIIKHLGGIKSPKVTWNNGDTIHSIPDGIAYALQQYVNKGGVPGILIEQRGGDLEDFKSEEEEINRGKVDLEDNCPKCGSEIEWIEGCLRCTDACGWSKC